MVNRSWHGAAARWGKESRPFADLLPLLLGSVLLVLLATTAGPAPTQALFQSPISPISPVGTTAPGVTVVPSPAAPQETAAGATATPSTLIAVPATPNLLPWIGGIVLMVVVVAVVVFWRGRGQGEGESQ